MLRCPDIPPELSMYNAIIRVGAPLYSIGHTEYGQQHGLDASMSSVGSRHVRIAWGTGDYQSHGSQDIID